MQYVVVDFEWNQAMSAEDPVFLRLPFRLQGEIMQIGAVRLSGAMQPLDEFKLNVRPVYFRRMHHRVKKLTGIDMAGLDNGLSFETAMERLKEWCRVPSVFLTWGPDDKRIMEQNLLLYDLDADWIAKWVNLQTIYSMQFDSSRNQKALKSVMDEFGIKQTRVAHDALGDAFNTALVCSKLDMTKGLMLYDKNTPKAAKIPWKPWMSRRKPAPLITVSRRADSVLDAVEGTDFALSCPKCRLKMEAQKWISSGKYRYMTMTKCKEHGSFFVKLGLKKRQDDIWEAKYSIYKADAETRALYRQKSSRRQLKARGADSKLSE